MDQNFQNLYPTNNQLVTLQMLALGRVDVTPMSELVMPDMASQAGIDLAQIERTDIKLYDSVLYLAFSNDVAKEQVEVWQRALDKLKSNGQYQAIKNRFLH
jgi:polar amino acid transport system substrate-binding protein